MQSVSLNKGSKMLNFINARMRVTIADSRVLVGTFMAFDKHMNVVLGDCEEFRRVKVKKAGGAGGTCSLRCSALALSELLRLRLGLIACGDACS
jgi:small nuclear ribonucleoprotein (snRNP)-like protein